MFFSLMFPEINAVKSVIYKTELSLYIQNNRFLIYMYICTYTYEGSEITTTTYYIYYYNIQYINKISLYIYSP